MGVTSEYREKMDAQLRKWDEDFDVLVAEGHRHSADARTAFHEKIADLSVRRSEAQKTLHEYYVAGEAVGAQMLAGVELAWESMRQALEKARADLRK